MAILGGAGNPVGGSFTGPAEALEIVGDHAYAYSGQFAANNTSPGTTHFEFTSGNYYLVGDLYCNGATTSLPNNVGNGRISVWDVSFNGVIIMGLKTDTIEEDSPSTTECGLIIPPYTEVKLVCGSDASDAGRLTSAAIVGRIYRTRD